MLNNLFSPSVHFTNLLSFVNHLFVLAALPAVEEYLSTEAPEFLELRVRYLQACERVPEAMALAKSCLENREAGKHLYFHQAYLTCLYKASLHEHLHKEVGENKVNSIEKRRGVRN